MHLADSGPELRREKVEKVSINVRRESLTSPKDILCEGFSGLRRPLFCLLLRSEEVSPLNNNVNYNGQ